MTLTQHQLRGLEALLQGPLDIALRRQLRRIYLDNTENRTLAGEPS